MTKEITQRFSLLEIYLKPKFYACFEVHIPVVTLATGYRPGTALRVFCWG